MKALSLLLKSSALSVMGISFLIMGCGSSSESAQAQVLETSCGLCQFSQTDQKGCFINVKIQDKVYPVVGAPKHTMAEMHQPGGYCVAIRKVETKGEVKGDRFLASSWKLLPMDENTPILPAKHD